MGVECENIAENDLFDFLRKRQKVLEGMCLTGGEPLIQVGVEDFLRKVKQLGYSVKLDTNGSNPHKLQHLVSQHLVDYVAMDVKNSADEYAKTAGANVDLSAILQSVEFLKTNPCEYEFRTTVTGNYHTEKSIDEMGKWLIGAKRLYLQKFVASEHLIDNTTYGCDDETLVKYRQILQQYVDEVHIRGVDVDN